MKKFISMVMAAAMVVSLVPATAFAAGDVSATAKVLDAIDMTETKADEIGGIIDESTYGLEVPEVQLTIKEADYRNTLEKDSEIDVTFTLDGAELLSTDVDYLLSLIQVEDEDGAVVSNLADEVTPGVDTVWTVRNSASKGTVVYDGNDADGETAGIQTLEIIDEVPAAADRAVVTVTKTVKEKVNDLIKDKYTIVGEVYDEENDEFTAGWAVKSGKPEIDLTTLVADTTTTTLTPQQWVDAEYPGMNYKAATIASVVEGSDEVVENDSRIFITVDDADDDYVTYTFTGFFAKDDVITFDLESELDYTTEGKKATVEVDSKLVDMEAVAYASIVGKVLKASVKKVVDVAEEEFVMLDKKGLKIEAAVGNLPDSTEEGTDGIAEDLTIKISKGFEFTAANDEMGIYNDDDELIGVVFVEDEDELIVDLVRGLNAGSITIKGIEIAADTAKEGDVATLTVYADDFTKAAVEVAKVCAYKVIMSVDADEDVPTFYNGVNVANDGLTVDDDHESLVVNIKETFAGAWSNHKDFTLTLPEGVHVIDVVNYANVGATADPVDEEDFWEAYQEGDHVKFEFNKRCFTETDPEDREAHEIEFKLVLVADPDFVGDVTLKLEGAAVDTQEVVIAKVLAPMTIKAEQNDVIIDYRFTEVKTDIVITEAEAGLWEEGLLVALSMDKADYIDFEDDAVFTVNAESDMEVEDATDDGVMTFKVTEESEDVAAVVTISGIELFMERNIPAGAYDLEAAISAVGGFEREVLFAPDCDRAECKCAFTDAAEANFTCANDEECFVADVCDYSDVVKEAWINVVTAGRDKDDASFTTKVVVPVGESYLVAGDKQYTLDVPAYINAAGYTMMPVRAVAVALGIDNDAVQWDNDTKTVIIMYGQRVITMTAGQKVVYASGTAIPAKSAVEIVDGRAFLGLRDLATALGVTEINYDAATKTATLN